MPLIAIPNISTAGGQPLDRAIEAVLGAEARVLDVHSDQAHNRSVLTCAGSAASLRAAMVGLARRCREIDLTEHEGVHPRLGGLDVCPFVPHDGEMDEAIAVARATATEIGGGVGIPVYLYGAAATRPETRDLPNIRRGGLARLMGRAVSDLPPDAGPDRIDRRVGVVCVGARTPLIAFNVWIRGTVDDARAIAAEVRQQGTVRALGLRIDDARSQVSVNLVDPARRGIDDVFDHVSAVAAGNGIEVTGTEIVGLPPARFMPAPDAKAARLLIEPGRSLETALAG